MQTEEAYYEEYYTADYDFIDEKEYHALITHEYLCTGSMYHLVSQKRRAWILLKYMGDIIPEAACRSAGTHDKHA